MLIARQHSASICHFPPKGEFDYDYANPRIVTSNADDWFNHHYLLSLIQLVNRETWGGPDYHLNYLTWWFSHLPYSPGWNPDARLNNWWRYLFEFDEYDARGQPRYRWCESPFALRVDADFRVVGKSALLSHGL